MQDVEAPPIVREPLMLGAVPIPRGTSSPPLAGYTSMAFRLAVRECGGLGLATTDLVNARSIVERRKRSFELAETCPQDQPMSIQIYGHVISEMQEAARWAVDQGASVVDINTGCLVNKVVKTGGGSALMCQADSATGAGRERGQCRQRSGHRQDAAGLGCSDPHGPALAREFENVGVAGVIIHGRTREQGFKGASTARGFERWSKRSTRCRSWATATSARLPTRPRRFERPAVRRSRSAAGHSRIRSCSGNSRTGPSMAPPGPSRPLRIGSTSCLVISWPGGWSWRAARLSSVSQDHQVVQPFDSTLKALYHRLINLASVSLFDETVAAIRGPVRPRRSGTFRARVPFPRDPSTNGKTGSDRVEQIRILPVSRTRDVRTKPLPSFGSERSRWRSPGARGGGLGVSPRSGCGTRFSRCTPTPRTTMARGGRRSG